MQRSSILITGGAGFIGANVARSYLNHRKTVHIFDNLSRAGVAQNIAELRSEFPDQVLFTEGDVRDRDAVKEAVVGATVVYHLAGQVAVTTSLESPIADFETNLLGTLNVLEAVRHSTGRPALLFTSTNKVYGKLPHLDLEEQETRYRLRGNGLREGVNERQPLQFLSPYGCSKGSADQYVLDYAASFGVQATVFRMSCIYGPYQMGTEDQGWVAHFLRQALKGEPVMLYGNGKQVRDLLFVGDLVRAMRLAVNNMGKTAGEVFNVGGGVEHTASLLEVLGQIHRLTGRAVVSQRSAERLGDQRWYVSDISKIEQCLQWSPSVSIGEGLRMLHEWYTERASPMTQQEVQVA